MGSPTLEPVGGTFEQPIFVTSDPEDPDRLLVVEQPGRVAEVLDNGPPTLFADLTGLVLPRSMTFAGIPAFRPSPPLVYRYSYGYFGFMPPIPLRIARGALEAFIDLAAEKRLQPVRSVALGETEQALGNYDEALASLLCRCGLRSRYRPAHQHHASCALNRAAD